MKLKNVKVGKEVVVKKTNPFLSKGEVVVVICVDLNDDLYDIRVLDNVGNRYWLNHKDVKKFKPEKVNTNIITLDGSKDTLVDFRQQVEVSN